MRKNHRTNDGRRIVLYNSMGGMIFHNAPEQYDLPRDMSDAYDMMEAACLNPDVIPVLVLEGGSDIDPSLYEEENTYSHTSDMTRRRDGREETLYHWAVSLGFFVWGNCRGHQLVAALNGGKLYQDLQRCGIWDHYDDAHVLVPMGTLTAIRPEPWEVNSLHHQAVSVIPPNAENVGEIGGVNEALWYESIPAFTVQFHPEFMGDVEFVYEVVRWYHANSGDRNRDSKSRTGVSELHSGA